ncbi:hypothetical protein LX32DRAFT_164431 [Colletotrichum zoysiae]|uniref:Uncharacterized protein n=1 Tax=Colletotrichum zoysiae TaxID=1216348 RepID=A0AAD9LWB2_9PEZI|nr:hypothetical protein LX32DRAFT_164431 [Colletotrichum zoysiae]
MCWVWWVVYLAQLVNTGKPLESNAFITHHCFDRVFSLKRDISLFLLLLFLFFCCWLIYSPPWQRSFGRSPVYIREDS